MIFVGVVDYLFAAGLIVCNIFSVAARWTYRCGTSARLNQLHAEQLVLLELGSQKQTHAHTSPPSLFGPPPQGEGGGVSQIQQKAMID